MKAMQDYTLKKRKDLLCHSIENDETGDEDLLGKFDETQEVWLDEEEGVLRTPMLCPKGFSDHAVIWGDQLLAQRSKSGTTVMYNDDVWNSDMRKILADCVMLPDWSLKDDWTIVTPVDSYPFVNKLAINKDGEHVALPECATEEELATRLDYIQTWASRIRYYVQHCIDHMKEHEDGNYPWHNGSNVPASRNDFIRMMNSLAVPKRIYNEAFAHTDEDPRDFGIFEIKNTLTRYVHRRLNLPHEV